MRTILIIFLLNIGLLQSMAYGAEPQSSAWYDKAQRILDKHHGSKVQLEKAFAILNKIEVNEPGSKYALVGYGRHSYLSGYQNNDIYNKQSLEYSKRYFEKAISLYPDFFDAFYYGAHPYLYSGNIEKASEMAGKARELERAENSGSVDLLYAEIARVEKNNLETVRMVNLSLEKDLDTHRLFIAYELLARSYKQEKLYGQAENAYKKVIELDPQSPWARSNYSNFLRGHRKNYDAAIEQAKAALKLMDFGMGHRVLGAAYYAKAVELSWEKRDYEASIDYFVLTVEEVPDFANAYYGLGIAYYQLGNQKKDKLMISSAEKALVTAVKLDPNNKHASDQLIKTRKILKHFNLSKQ